MCHPFILILLLSHLPASLSVFGSDRPLLQFELQTLPSLTEVEVSVSSGSSVAVLFHSSVRVFGT